LIESRAKSGLGLGESCLFSGGEVIGTSRAWVFGTGVGCAQDACDEKQRHETIDVSNPDDGFMKDSSNDAKGRRDQNGYGREIEINQSLGKERRRMSSGRSSKSGLRRV
jgi:hypothetical protein